MTNDYGKLRAKMSPEAQARLKARAEEMLREMDECRHDKGERWERLEGVDGGTVVLCAGCGRELGRRSAAIAIDIYGGTTK